MRTELFLDDREIEAIENLHRSFHKAEGGKPVIHPEFAWEGAAIHPMTVVYDPTLKKFRMWYQTYARSTEAVSPGGEKEILLRDDHFRYGVGYAESEDGYHFTKPRLGKVKYDGQDTNIALRGYYSPSPQTCIMRMDEPNPQKRFRLWVWDEAPYPGKHSLIGMSLYVSADGFNWKGYEWNDGWCHDPQPFCYIKMVGEYRYPYNIGPNEANGILWDERINKYVNYCRATNGSVRCIARMESEDGIHWAPPVLVAMPDLSDPFLFQFYWTKPHRRGEFVILYVMTHAPCQGHKCNVQILASRDGFNFTRVGDRQVWMENGPAGSWNGGMISPSAPVMHDGKLWVYVGGTPGAHDVPDADISGSIGLYQFRPDGYASLDAGGSEGSFTTRKMVWLHDHIHINADASRGEVRVEILSGEGWNGHAGKAQVTSFSEHYASGLPGFTRDDCVPFTGDNIDAKMAFKSKSLLELKGKYVQLRFYLLNAKMYSWSVS